MTRKLCSLFVLGFATLNAADFQVTDYGAKGDGKTIDTQGIQRAIDAAAAAHGTVFFKSGVYLTGALFLKSGMKMSIGDGVTIRGVQNLAAYPEMPTRVAGIEMTWPSALVNIYRQSNVELSGSGTIDGDGKYWWDSYWRLRKDYEPKGLRWASDYDAKRVRLIQVYDSSNVRLTGLRLERSGFWTVHLCYSHNISVDGVTIRNNIGGRGPSTDGIDIDSSSTVTVQQCDIECNDDALCLKAGRDADGLRVNRPTENVTIRDCTVRDAAAGVTVGSETSGGIHDVKVSGIHVLGAVPKGICFKSAKTRGGTVERIDIGNMDMRGVPAPVSITANWNPSYSYAHIPPDSKSVPEYWHKLAQQVPPEKGLPHFRNVTVSGIHATGAKRAFEVEAYPNDPIENFTFTNIDIQAETAGRIADAWNWVFTKTHIETKDGSHVILKDCRNVKGLP
ncbi:MAG: right-handed parallel beta-helix repeat-containing protein [Acidobacteriaceae bacterium]|nr:right-handed parallel beta-helix repeat-containing protein [Acidobacteriaceae bacterium]